MTTNERIERLGSLDEIIRELPKYPRTFHENMDRQIITIEKSSGEILEERPLLPFLNLKKLRYFEVNKKKVIFNIAGPRITTTYLNAINPFCIDISYDAKISDMGLFKLVQFVNSFDSPVKAINDAIETSISGYIFDNKDFVHQYSMHKSKLVEKIIGFGNTIGLELMPYLLPNHGSAQAEEFVGLEHTVIAKTRDAQSVEIRHDLALTLDDQVKFSLSAINDIKTWAKKKMEQFTLNVIIEKTYAEVLLNMTEEEAAIKKPMQEECKKIGYELKQLVTVPGLEIESFYFETFNEQDPAHSNFSTKDARLKIALNIIAKVRLDLSNDKTKNCIKPGIDIISKMKGEVILLAQHYINDKDPDECFSMIHHLEHELIKHIYEELDKIYGFKERNIVIKFLENEISKRIAMLQERPYKVNISGDWTARAYTLSFRVQQVNKDGWFRFRANNYIDITEELTDIADIVKNGMEQYLLRPSVEINSEMIGRQFEFVKERVIAGFGLDILLHDFVEELSHDEQTYARSKTLEIEKRLNINKQMLISEKEQLEALIRKRAEAIELEEPEEVVEELDRKIDEIKNRNTNNREELINRKVGNVFLLDPGNQ